MQCRQYWTRSRLYQQICPVRLFSCDSPIDVNYCMKWNAKRCSFNQYWPIWVPASKWIALSKYSEIDVTPDDASNTPFLIRLYIMHMLVIAVPWGCVFTRKNLPARAHEEYLHKGAIISTSAWIVHGTALMFAIPTMAAGNLTLNKGINNVFYEFSDPFPSF